MKTTTKALIVSGALLLIFLVTAGVISLAHQPYVNYVSAQVIPGYETRPAYYAIQASPGKVWHDTNGVLRGLGFILAALSGLIVLWAGEDTSKSKSAFWALVGVFVVSAALIFGKHAANLSSAEYTMKLCPVKYEQVKDNLDDLFPNTVHAEQDINNCK